MKRIIDIIGSSFLLLLLSPLLIITASIVLLGLGRPIIFKQMRPGLYGNPFYILKFRTMLDKKDDNGILLPEEQRLTRLGKIIRKVSLDELPQLFNVIKGDMSLVGPRPLLMEYLNLYTPQQARRHDVRPGITGWAQINGRNEISWDTKFDLDVWYVDNQSFWVDTKILILTFYKVLKREGISAKGHYSMERFEGGNEQQDVQNG